jgi:hypothetical protein
MGKMFNIQRRLAKDYTIKHLTDSIYVELLMTEDSFSLPTLNCWWWHNLPKYINIKSVKSLIVTLNLVNP